MAGHHNSSGQPGDSGQFHLTLPPVPTVKTPTTPIQSIGWTGRFFSPKPQDYWADSTGIPSPLERFFKAMLVFALALAVVLVVASALNVISIGGALKEGISAANGVIGTDLGDATGLSDPTPPQHDAKAGLAAGSETAGSETAGSEAAGPGSDSPSSGNEAKIQSAPAGATSGSLADPPAQAAAQAGAADREAATAKANTPKAQRMVGDDSPGDREPINARVSDGGTTLPMSAIVRVVSRKTNALIPCFQDAIDRSEIKPGNISLALSWKIRRDGSVFSPKVKGPARLAKTSLGRCIPSAMRSWVFPRAASTTVVDKFPLGPISIR